MHDVARSIEISTYCFRPLLDYFALNYYVLLGEEIWVNLKAEITTHCTILAILWLSGNLLHSCVGQENSKIYSKLILNSSFFLEFRTLKLRENMMIATLVRV